MKRILALILAAAAAVPALANTNVGVSIGISQPGVYGRIDIGNYPQPALVYPQPVVIYPPQVAMPRQPVYLYVPPGHQKNWAKHCARYNACNQPVYFVQEQWVRERYAHEHPGWRDGRGAAYGGYEREGRGYDGRGYEGRGNEHGYDRGNGHGNGHGNGNGHGRGHRD